MEDEEKVGKNTKKIHPKAKAGILSSVFFCWAIPIFAKGFKKDLTEEDLYGPLKIHKSKTLGDKLELNWNTEVAKGKDPSLGKIIAKTYWTEMIPYIALLLIQELAVKTTQPLLVGKLMEFYTPHQETISKEQAYFYAIGIILLSLVNVMLLHWTFFGLHHLSIRMRVACCSLIYRKALRLSTNALAESTVGQMVNLMSNDVARFDYLVLHLHHVFVAPVQALIVLFLIYINVHPAAMVGVVVLICFIPVQLYMGKKTSYYRMRTAKKTDQRVKLMNEIISGIQVIKMYTWEKPFSKLVEISRSLEIKEIRSNAYLRAINQAISIFLIRTSIFLCVLTYVLTGNTLQAQYVFVVSSFYNTIRQPLAVHLPKTIALLAEVQVSISRIRKFLLNEEVSLQLGEPSFKGINLDNISTKWPSSSNDHTLKNVTLQASSGELIAVVGPVGAGKSTLLNVILQELKVKEGEVAIGGKISYASQEPWLFSASIRQNILFGEPMDVKRYQEVVKVCALERDFAMLPFGDRTIVGERGVMLSGGQKARVNLARAVYKKADIYLLDDPLSAVDSQVGKELLEDCVMGYLSGKCRVLITHQLQFLHNADRIYLLENGKVTISGTYEKLKNSGEDFVQLLNKEVKQEIETEVTEITQKHDNNDNNNSEKRPIEVKEHRSVGSISRKVYWRYFGSGQNWYFPIFLFFTFVLAQVLASGADYFLAFWTNIEQNKFENQSNYNIPHLGEILFTSENCLYLYSTIVISLVVISLTRSLSFVNFSTIAARNLHNNMFGKIVYSTMRFFHTNTSGRVLNRFAKDMGTVDEGLPTSMMGAIQLALNVLAITIIITSVSHWIIIPTVIVFVVFYCYKIVFLATSRDLKRIEGTSRSPVFSHLSASLQGLTTIRALHAQEVLKTEFDNHQDLHTSAAYLFMACTRTFAFWLDVNCVGYIALVILSFLFIGTETYGGNVGLAITQSITLTGMLQQGIRQWSELENQMTSVERVLEYTELEKEPDEGTKVPSQIWPSEGVLQFRNLSMRYASDLPLVLNDLSFHVGSGEKIGIVGRTGAGKSSLISALFRLARIEGEIIIDGVDSKSVPLNTLRSKISIIPQEPVLFSGTLRKNLDPFEEFSDEALWNALEEVELKEVVAEMSAGLHSTVAEGGSNFSVGQRQLLCLGRAVVRSNKILVLDEATANVDPQTDELIQSTIRRKFKVCTVLTIAHRLHTVMDSDKVLVISAGHAVEFDHPHILLQNKNGVFTEMVKQTGGMAENLERIAEMNFQETIKR